MVYHPIHCLQMNSCTTDMVETVIFDQMSPHYDPAWRQEQNTLVWHFGPWCCITIPYQLWLQKVQQQRRHHLNSTFTGILNFFCDLDLDHNKAIQSFHKTIHLVMMCHQTKFTCKRISSSDNIFKKSYFDIILNCDLDLEDSKPLHLKDNLAHNDASPYHVWQ